MASSHQARQEKPGLITNQHMDRGWDFQGSMITEAPYADDLNCDADAAADEAVVDDSGYFSRAASEERRSSKREEASSSNQPFTYAAEPSIAHSHGNAHSYIAAASTEASNGSAVEDSLQHTGASNPGWHRGSYQGAAENPTYANLSSEVVTGPSALEEWARTPHRHEEIAYRLVRAPGKKRTARR